MNIPLEPTRPLTGVASPGAGVDPPRQEAPPQQRRYIPRALSPARMWALIRVISKMTKADPQMVAQGIVPVVRVGARVVKLVTPQGTVETVGYIGGRNVGFPGSGVFRGRQNIAKSVTYRATGVPGGFNVERDNRRRDRAWARLQESIDASDTG